MLKDNLKKSVKKVEIGIQQKRMNSCEISNLAKNGSITRRINSKEAIMHVKIEQSKNWFPKRQKNA